MNAVLNAVQDWLRCIRYEEYFVLAPVLLLALCCMARLVCMAMTVLSPAKFSAEHRKTLYSTAASCCGLSLLMQVLLWVFGTEGQLEVLARANDLAACLLTGIALASFLSAILSMLFTRKGRRVFIARSLNASALTLVLTAFVLTLFGRIFMA